MKDLFAYALACMLFGMCAGVMMVGVLAFVADFFLNMWGLGGIK